MTEHHRVKAMKRLAGPPLDVECCADGAADAVDCELVDVLHAESCIPRLMN
jgi:hypothetical protein